MTLQIAQANQGVIVIKSGQAAPADGIHYTNEAHAKLVAKIKGQAARCKVDTNHAVKVAVLEVKMKLTKWKLEADTFKRQLQLSEDFVVNQRKLLLEQVVKSQRISWYRSTWFLLTMGVVLTVGVGAFSVWTFNSLQKND